MKSWLIWKDPDAGKDWRQEEKGTTEDGQDGWMASPTQWTWVWVNCRSLWWTGRPGVLQFMRSQRVGHDWATELNWTKNNSRIWLRTLSIALKEELKVLDLVFWLNYYSFVSLDCFLVFLHFLSSLIKFSLWNLEGLGGSSLSINKRQGDTRVVTVPGKATQYPTSFQ